MVVATLQHYGQLVAAPPQNFRNRRPIVLEACR